MKIRSARHHDIAALQDGLTGTGLFPGEMLPDTLGGFLSGVESAGRGLDAAEQ